MKRLMPALLVLVAILMAACDAVNTTASSTSIDFSEPQGAVVEAGSILTVNVANEDVGVWRYAVRVNGALVAGQVFSRSVELPESQSIPVIVPEAGGTHRISVTVTDGDAREQHAELQLRVPQSATEDGEPPLAAPAAAVQWFSPTLSSSLSGVVDVRFSVVANRAIELVAAALVRDSDGADQALPLTLSDGSYSSSFNADDLTPGLYHIRVSALLETGDAFSFERSGEVVLVTQDSIEWFSPNLGASIAGVHTFSFALQSQHQISSVRTFLVAVGSGSVNLVQSGMQPDSEGRYEASVNTLAHAPGEYALQVEVAYADGSRRDFERIVNLVDPFTITSLTDGDIVGPGSPQGRVQVAITVGDADGLLRLRGVRVTGADIYLDNRLLASLDDLATPDDNAFLSFPWDSSLSVAGGHDASLPGDRVVVVRVRYVIGEGDEQVTGARFTPPVLLEYRPAP